ncbi:MAG: TIGR03086 family protein [Chloroflexi bacterium]|nr:TIGR03086 family protein [Chloroflexota bacterium]
MTQAGTPNPIELYEGARDYMIPIIGGVQASQLSGSTPCTEWNVKQLINHNLLVAEWIHRTLTGGEGVDPFAVDGDLPEEGAQAAFAAVTNKVLDAIKAPGMLEKVITTPFGEMPAGNFLMFPFGDILIHKWDLAKATNLDTAMDSSMADACLQVMSPMLQGNREGGFFGPEVTVPIDASDRDKLLGLCGRNP